jgi:3-O-methylgallate 3,4-dioxygenase
MADIVLGIATSHGPLLTIPHELWDRRNEVDRHRNHSYRGASFTFDELANHRATEGLEEKSGLMARAQQRAACQEALAILADAYGEAKPDIAVVIGNDQAEIFDHSNIPAFLVYFGEIIENIPHSEAQKQRLPPGVVGSEPGYHATEIETFPGHPALGRHLIEALIDANFDVAASRRLPEIPNSHSSGIPHAYGFVFRQIFGNCVVPTVPIFLNATYPPNQPTTSRCYALGEALATAIRQWPSDTRVAIIASGGMSHFVVDEKLDRDFLGALQRGDAKSLLAIPATCFTSGTSELRNWIPLAGAMIHCGLQMNVVDYVACYRSVSGTGCGMGFAYWR